PFFATMPTTMMSPMNDDTLNVVRVTSSAKNTPDVERIADERIATGGVNERNSNSSTRKMSTTARARTVVRSRNDFCCSLYVPPYSTRIDGGSFRSATVFC